MNYLYHEIEFKLGEYFKFYKKYYLFIVIFTIIGFLLGTYLEDKKNIIETKTVYTLSVDDVFLNSKKTISPELKKKIENINKNIEDHATNLSQRGYIFTILNPNYNFIYQNFKNFVFSTNEFQSENFYNFDLKKYCDAYINIVTERIMFQRIEKNYLIKLFFNNKEDALKCSNKIKLSMTAYIENYYDMHRNEIAIIKNKIENDLSKELKKINLENIYNFTDDELISYKKKLQFFIKKINKEYLILEDFFNYKNKKDILNFKEIEVINIQTRSSNLPLFFLSVFFLISHLLIYIFKLKK